MSKNCTKKHCYPEETGCNYEGCEVLKECPHYKNNMIEAKEIRLNNKVLFNGVNSEIFEIRQNNKIRIKFVRSDNNKDHVGLVDISDIEPIPLTEEWLIKFGFEKQNKGYDQIDNDVYAKEGLFIIWYNSGQENFMQAFVYNKSIDINTVHELQNLYFALTKTELQLKQ